MSLCDTDDIKAHRNLCPPPGFVQIVEGSPADRLLFFGGDSLRWVSPAPAAAVFHFKKDQSTVLVTDHVDLSVPVAEVPLQYIDSVGGQKAHGLFLSHHARLSPGAGPLLKKIIRIPFGFAAGCSGVSLLRKDLAQKTPAVDGTGTVFHDRFTMGFGPVSLVPGKSEFLADALDGAEWRGDQEWSRHR